MNPDEPHDPLPDRLDALVAANGRAATYRAALRAIAAEARQAADSVWPDLRAVLRAIADHAEFVAGSDEQGRDELLAEHLRRGRAVDLPPKWHIHWAPGPGQRTEGQ